MMSGTEKGGEVRDYFIECERRAQNPAAALTRLDLFRMGLEAEERAVAAEAKAKQLAGQVRAMAPKAQALDRLSTAQGDLLHP